MESKLSRWNQGLQIAAILVAGVWAVWTFSVSVWPKFNSAFDGKLTLDSDWFSELETCIFTIEAEVTNKSVRRKMVDRVEFYGTWETLPPKPKIGQFTMVDFALKREGPGNLNLLRPALSPLIFEYAPGQTGTDGFQVLSEPTPGQVLYVEMILYDDKGTTLGFWYEWAPACQKSNESNK